MGLFRKKTAPQIKPVEEQRKGGKGSKPVERDAMLAVDRNRWFYVSVGLLVLCLLLGLQVMQANKRFANNVQVAWVKMSPNGTWDIDFFDAERGQEFYQTTIDYMLAQFVERRYSKIRTSIKADYGFSLQFMSPPLSRRFLDANDFNAPQKIADFLADSGDETIIEVGAIDHYDSDITTFGQSEGTLYRTNVFVNLLSRGENGTIIGEPEQRIVAVQWRIKSKEEVQSDQKQLRINPIGLEILKIDILDDPKARRG
jgi:hypothetical protein